MDEDQGDQERLEYLRAKLAELVAELGDCPAWKVGHPWWNDRLEEAALVRREMDCLERGEPYPGGFPDA